MNQNQINSENFTVDPSSKFHQNPVNTSKVNLKWVADVLPIMLSFIHFMQIRHITTFRDETVSH